MLYFCWFFSALARAERRWYTVFDARLFTAALSVCSRPRPEASRAPPHRNLTGQRAAKVSDEPHQHGCRRAAKHLPDNLPWTSTEGHPHADFCRAAALVLAVKGGTSASVICGLTSRSLCRAEPVHKSTVLHIDIHIKTITTGVYRYVIHYGHETED